MTMFNGVKYSDRHGGAFDRGSADSYYRRAFQPHMFEAGTHTSRLIPEAEMSAEDRAAYAAGYAYNEDLGDYKDWR